MRTTGLRRLNETNEGFLRSVDRLQTKCLKSRFSEKMVLESMDTIRTWTTDNAYTNDPRVKRKPPKRRIPWTTQFKNIVKLTEKEKDLAPNAAVTFCRPTTLGSQLKNHKLIAKGQSQVNSGSQPCGKCGLCGGFGNLKNMVLQTNVLKLNNGTEIPLRNTITCKDHGIYAAQCNQCMDLYIGQTKNSFHTRWNTHRNNWNKMIKGDGCCGGYSKEKDKWKENYALFLHYSKSHKEWLTKHNLLADAYKVIFLEKPNPRNLDIRESVWIGKVQAKINIAKTCLPKYKLNGRDHAWDDPEMMRIV